MELEKLHDPEKRQLRVAGLMSGSGTNLRKIIEHEKKLEAGGKAPYKVAVIFSDNAESNAVKIGKDFDVPVVARDLRAFYAARGKPRKDLAVREEFDRETVRALEPFGADAAAYAGYMSIATKPLIEAFLGVNVHPADLSVMDNGGKRKFVGAHAVRDAILAGEKTIRATTHIIEPKVDMGRILMVSAPLEVQLPDNFDANDKELVKKVALEHQERLKEAGDWIVFPKTLQYIAEGRFAKDSEGKLYFDGKPVPTGAKTGE